MDVMEAKKLVIEAGHKLVENGLIARTWGNVSCRIDDKSFVITPSGMSYDRLTPADIVEVAIDTLEYSGDVKPSSEKGIHAEVYKARKDANFVIHTHQLNASVVSTFDTGIPSLKGEAKELIGKEVLLAAYGLPGTGKLKKGVAAAIAATDSKAVIMARHGALCFGKDFDETFRIAAILEDVCDQYVVEKANSVLGEKSNNIDDFCFKFAKSLTNSEKALEIKNTIVYNSFCDRATGEVVFTAEDGSTAKMNLLTGNVVGDGLLPTYAEYHRSMYLVGPHINYIVHNNSAACSAVSSLGIAMRPLLDDFAQIVGPKVSTAVTAEDCKRSAKNTNAAFIKDGGALCGGTVESDAHAVDMITEKTCRAYLGAKLFGASNPISRFEAKLMRTIYLKKYSKRAGL